MRFVLVAAAVAAVSLAGCGKKEAAPEKPAAAADAGKAAAAKARMPDFAPLYPDAKIETDVAEVGNDKADGGTLVYEVEASPAEVVAFYKEKSAAAGFKTEMDANMGPAHMFAASDKASGKALQVIASDAGAGASVQLIWATKVKKK